MDALVQTDSVLLDHDLLLHERVHLLLQKVALVDIVRLQLLKVLLQVCYVFNDLFKNVVGGLGGVVFESCAFRSQKLDLLLVVIEQFAGLFGASLWHKK